MPPAADRNVPERVQSEGVFFRAGNDGHIWNYELYNSANVLLETQYQFVFVTGGYPSINDSNCYRQIELGNASTYDNVSNILTMNVRHYDGWNWSGFYDAVKFRTQRKQIDKITVDGYAFAFPDNHYAVLNLFESGSVSSSSPVSRQWYRPTEGQLNITATP